MPQQLPSPPTLTIKQEKFCYEYAISGNGTESAIRAGYGRKGAREQASRLLRNVNIASRIHELMEAKTEKLDLTLENVLSELKAIAFAKISDVLEWDADGTVRVKASERLTNREASPIASVTVRKDAISSLKLHDKIRALEVLLVRCFDVEAAIVLLHRRGYDVVETASAQDGCLDFESELA
jgi:phage terminase small subunit